MGYAINAKKDRVCHDCRKEMGDKEGFLLKYKDGEEVIEAVKCESCYKKNPSLSNFRSCEVYSRVVGYVRPVRQWNVGKRREFGDRKNYV